MNRVLCSTGGVIGRPNGRDITLLYECAQRLECDGFEFMMYETWYEKIDFIKKCVLDTGVKIPVFHVEKQVGELISRGGEENIKEAVRLFYINCNTACVFGADTLVLHLWGGICSDKNISENIKTFGRLYEISKKFGLCLTVENVVCNRLDPLTHLRALAKEYPEILFTYDTKMAEFHNQTKDILLPENAIVASRIRHFHINDYGGGYMDWQNLKTLHIGEGKVDFDTLFEYIKSSGYKGDFTVEATSFGTDGIIDFDSLNRDFCKIREYIK